MQDFPEWGKDKALHDFKYQFYSGDINCHQIRHKPRFLDSISRQMNSPDSRQIENSQTTSLNSSYIKPRLPGSSSTSFENHHLLPLANSIPLKTNQEEIRTKEPPIQQLSASPRQKEEMKIFRCQDILLSSKERNTVSISKQKLLRLPTLPPLTPTLSKKQTMNTEAQLEQLPSTTTNNKSIFEPFNFNPYSEVVAGTYKIKNICQYKAQKESHSVDQVSQGGRKAPKLKPGENTRDQTSRTSTIVQSSKGSFSINSPPQYSKKQSSSPSSPKASKDDLKGLLQIINHRRKSENQPNTEQQIDHSRSVSTNSNKTTTSKAEKYARPIAGFGSSRMLDSIILKCAELNANENNSQKLESLSSKQQKVHGKKMVLTRKVAKISQEKQRRIKEILTASRVLGNDQDTLNNIQFYTNNDNSNVNELQDDTNCKYESLSNYYDAKYRKEISIFKQEPKGLSSNNKMLLQQPNQILFNEFLPWGNIENNHSPLSQKTDEFQSISRTFFYDSNKG